MLKLVKCRPCGYVMKEEDLGDTCPACGLPRKVFEDYVDHMSYHRRAFLSLDLHPIAVHFPQTILVFMIQALLVTLFFPTFMFNEQLIGLTQILAFFLPFSVFVAFITGIVDGKIRFRTLKSPIMQKKMKFGILMMVSSLPTPFLALQDVHELSIKLWLLVACTIGLLCALVLGHAGKHLMGIGVGGKLKIWGYKF